MQGIIFGIRGSWAQFRKPETNNTPLTHDFITKTALIGLIGAVLGAERDEMRTLFPQLSDDLLYGVQIHGVVKKETWQFTLRSASDPNGGKSPRPMEFLRDPNYTVTLVLANQRSSDVFQRFATSLQHSEARFTPTLGLHNCPAELEWKTAGDFHQSDGMYKTKGFIRRSHRFTIDADFTKFRVGFERVPTFQSDDWWNLPDRYCEVAYPSGDAMLAVSGEHYRFEKGEAWCLI